MTFEAFELAIIDLASRRVRITVANVAMHTRLSPSRVEEMLDRMACDGRLDVELDEDRGCIFYVVRGLTPPPEHLVVRSSYQAPRPVETAARGNKSVALGTALGFLAPGVGLLYAAPWKAAAVISVAIVVGVQMVGAIPLLGWLLSSVVLGLAALISAVLGAIYTRKYNQMGRRTHLDIAATRQAGRTLVDPLRQAQRAVSS